jgi:hypothetical protein
MDVAGRWFGLLFGDVHRPIEGLSAKLGIFVGD